MATHFLGSVIFRVTGKNPNAALGGMAHQLGQAATGRNIFEGGDGGPGQNQGFKPGFGKCVGGRNPALLMNLSIFHPDFPSLLKRVETKPGTEPPG